MIALRRRPDLPRPAPLSGVERLDGALADRRPGRLTPAAAQIADAAPREGRRFLFCGARSGSACAATGLPTSRKQCRCTMVILAIEHVLASSQSAKRFRVERGRPPQNDPIAIAFIGRDLRALLRRVESPIRHNNSISFCSGNADGRRTVDCCNCGGLSRWSTALPRPGGPRLCSCGTMRRRRASDDSAGRAWRRRDAETIAPTKRSRFPRRRVRGRPTASRTPAPAFQLGRCRPVSPTRLGSGWLARDRLVAAIERRSGSAGKGG